MPQGSQRSRSSSPLPSSTRQHAEEIAALTDRFCSEHLDAEYGALCRKMSDKLARKRPSPLLRGKVSIWAGAVLYAVGSVNFLFDPQQRRHLSASQLSTLTGIPQSTLANKARIIRELLRIVPLQPEFCRRELLADNPLAWMIQVNGVLVDARMMPPEIQEEARRKGLIPDLT
jgi:hypothetical protein